MRDICHSKFNGLHFFHENDILGDFLSRSRLGSISLFYILAKFSSRSGNVVDGTPCTNILFSTRYITHLSVSGSESILSLQSSISSYRRSSHARSSNRFSNDRRSENYQENDLKSYKNISKFILVLKGLTVKFSPKFSQFHIFYSRSKKNGAIENGHFPHAVFDDYESY